MNEKQAMVLQNDLVQVCEKIMMVKQPKTVALYKKIVFDTSVEWAKKNGFKYIKASYNAYPFRLQYHSNR